METKSSQKSSQNLYKCECCHYISSKISNFNKHLLTPKHLRKREETLLATFSSKKGHESSSNDISPATFFVTMNNDEMFKCEKCERIYKNRSGLWKHNKNGCLEYNISENSIIVKENENENEKINDEELKIMLKEMMKCFQKDSEMKNELLNQLKEQNKIITEQQKSINEMIPKVGNNNNNKFNLNFFLNEQCKDALNMSDFIKGLEIQLKDLMYTKNNGIIEGVSNVFVNGLKQLETTKRPIHCTDIKRETLYIKEHDEWEKDEDNKEKLIGALNNIAFKQRRSISDWEKNNPNWIKSDKGKDDYINLIRSVMAEVPSGAKDNKIIKNIVKELQINKD